MKSYIYIYSFLGTTNRVLKVTPARCPVKQIWTLFDCAEQCFRLHRIRPDRISRFKQRNGFSPHNSLAHVFLRRAFHWHQAPTGVDAHRLDCRKLGLPQGAMLPWQEARRLNQPHVVNSNRRCVGISEGL